MLVVDASLIVDVILEASPAQTLMAATADAGEELIAPPLFWSEATSVLHALTARGMVAPDRVAVARGLLARAAVRRDPPGLLDRAWSIADRMGWARTYDAEYCALAEIANCELVTTDARLRRAAEGRLPYVLDPAEAMVR